MNKTISLVVSVYNGENLLDECLKSADFVDEIVIVNNSSTDQTLDKAKKYTDCIFTRPNFSMLNINKNFGFTKSHGEWILNLDADERLSPELAEEIKSEINNPKSEKEGYWIPRKNIIFGKWIKHTGWYPDYQLRLFKKGKGKFPEKHVHEMIKVDGEIAHLKNNIIHYNYEKITQFLYKMIKIYAPNEADELIKNGYKFKWQDSIQMPTKEFLSRFFARKGFKDGFHGLILSILMAFYHFIIFAIIWEKNSFKEVSTNLIEETEKEFKNTYKDYMYWTSKEKLNSQNNIINKLIFKIFQKLNS